MPRKPTGDHLQVDLAISPFSFLTALERMAAVADSDVPHVSLKLEKLGADEMHWTSADGAFELILKTDGRWSCMYHAVIKADV